MSDRTYDAVVVGLGAMGSATLFHLARLGLRVLGLEQYAPGHRNGSSHGDSRIIRESYFEHPLYVPLVQRAHQLWRELEQAAGEPLMTIRGGLMIGPPDGSIVSGTLRSAREHGLPHDLLSAEQVHDRFPPFRFGDELVAVFDPRAGYLDPEACNSAHVAAALAKGAVAHFNEPVMEWSAAGRGVQVRTHSGVYSAEWLVLSGGGWNKTLAGDLKLPLEIERQAVFWLDPRGEHDYDPERFPIYAYEYEAGHICYGFPRLPGGVKASVMHSGEIAESPEGVRRAVGDDERDALRRALRPVLPALASAPDRDRDTCIFSNTPDHDFIIDWHPSHPNVLISSPCSGHGFKFASAIGELQADLVTRGSTRFDLTPFSLARFPSALSRA